MINLEDLQSFNYAFQAELAKLWYGNCQVQMQELRKGEEYLVNVVDTSNPFGMMDARSFTIFEGKDETGQTVAMWKEGGLLQYPPKDIN